MLPTSWAGFACPTETRFCLRSKNTFIGSFFFLQPRWVCLFLNSMEKLKMWFGSINELQCMNSHNMTELSLDFLENNKAYYANTIPLLRVSSNLRGIYYSFVVKKNITG